MRVIMCGSRDWSDPYPIRLLISGLNIASNHEGKLVIVHGAARGADTIIDGEARRLGITTEPHPADWDNFGTAAGPRRNQKMARLGADLCVAFLARGARNVGTRNMLLKARQHNIPTMEVTA